jgi:hypothetical protein
MLSLLMMNEPKRPGPIPAIPPEISKLPITAAEHPRTRENDKEVADNR